MRNFESRKALALLGYLAAHEEPISRSRLAGLFWGEKSEARGRRNLSRELSQLSSRLPNCFQADYHTVQFLPTGTYWVDTLTFAALVKKSNQPDLQVKESLAYLAEAVALYHSDFMTGYYLDDCPEFETWLIRQQENWRRQVTEILERLFTQLVSLGQDDQAEAHLRRWLELEPWQEEAHRYLMILLAHNGKRTAALAQFEICRRVLDEELGAAPEAETLVLYEQIQAGEIQKRDSQPLTFPKPASSSGPPVPPPPPSSASPTIQMPVPSTSLVGRQTELAQIVDHLLSSEYRLLTLVGPGGIGKTRLAIQAGQQLAQLLSQEKQAIPHPYIFPDGLYFISLESLSSAEFLISTLADALQFSLYGGSDPVEQILNYLQDKRMLLILDNFEHLLPMSQNSQQKNAADFVGDILERALNIKILVVSRERLNLQEEHLLPIEGLSVPDLPPNLDHNQIGSASRGWLDQIESYSSVQLFLERARAVRPDFILSETDKLWAARICRLTEGIPLAIELAAAWLRMLSCQEIAQEIKQNLDFLATSLRNVPERQRSLRAVFDYSWQLLSNEEKRIFRQLAVFRGGFRREAAQQVAGASLPLLLALTDKSLLRRTETGRYDRHLLIWQYALAKLDELPQEKETVQDCHCDYFSTFLQEREEALKGGNQKQALGEINIEIENVRLAWRHAVATEKTPALEQALESLFHFYDVRSWFQEGAEAFGLATTVLLKQLNDELTNQQPSAHDASATPALTRIVLGKLLARQGWFVFQLGQHEPAKMLLQKSLALLRTEGKSARQALVFPLNYLGAVHRHLGEYDLAKTCLEESQVICQEYDDRLSLTISLTILAQIAYLQGDYEQAKALCEQSLVLKQEIGDDRGVTFALNTLGQVAYTLGDYQEAKRLFQESLAICQEVGDDRGTALCLAYLGDVVQMLKEYVGAKQLFEESLAIFKEVGNQWGVISATIKLGYVVMEMGDYNVAKKDFTGALHLALNTQAIPAVLDALVGLAYLINKTEPAKEKEILDVLSLALNHPASSQENQNRAAQLLTRLGPELKMETVRAARTATEQNKMLNLTVSEILAL